MKKCFVCGHDRLKNDYTNKMIEEKSHFVIIKEIPCFICENCGEIYFETDVILKLEKIIDKNVSELEIINFQQVA